ncbi:MAG: ATP-binding protein [Bacteroidales bacterium]|nr:ATP-binding protein [Bacteroidales bacterium]
MKQLPYGIDNFEYIRRKDMYYVDKTMYLPLIERQCNNLLLIRPRRFGKSLFVNMLTAYYDVARKDDFQALFGDLWIGQYPTPEANSFQIMRFDFSKAGSSIDTLESDFNLYCCRELDSFITKYAQSYPPFLVDSILASKSAKDKLNAITIAARDYRLSLYLIIDEYDNFTNNILSVKGKEKFQEVTHADGFYREFFKLFKGSFERIFLLGVSPITLDELTSGFNIDWNISGNPKFNSMLGFEEREVREMVAYYKREANIPGEIDDIIKQMKPWYDNYCFSEKAYGRETVYNCDMVIYYLLPLILQGMPPVEMVDKNIRTDFSKLQMLVDIDHGQEREIRLKAIEEIANQGYVDMTLKTSFPASELKELDNFRSLLYYYGMLSIGGGSYPRTRMIIPNECVRLQYWNFMFSVLQKRHKIDIGPLLGYYEDMIFRGQWHKAIDFIGKAYKDTSSVRDSLGGEFKVQGFFKAYLGICTYALLCPELELNYGFSDFVMIPLQIRFPEAKHCYIIELKYAPLQSSESAIAKLEAEAVDQIKRYAQDPRLLKAIEGCTLHGLKVVFLGPSLHIYDQVLEIELP